MDPSGLALTNVSKHVTNSPHGLFFFSKIIIVPVFYFEDALWRVLISAVRHKVPLAGLNRAKKKKLTQGVPPSVPRFIAL